MHCSVIEHGMASLSFQTAAQKNEAKLMTSGLELFVFHHILTVQGYIGMYTLIVPSFVYEIH